MEEALRKRYLGISYKCWLVCWVWESGISTLHWIFWRFSWKQGLPRWFNGKASTRQCRRQRHVCLIPESGRFPGIGNDDPLQYSCLENSMDREVWRAAVHRVAKSQTQLSTHTQLKTYKKTPWCFKKKNSGISVCFQLWWSIWNQIVPLDTTIKLNKIYETPAFRQ